MPHLSSSKLRRSAAILALLAAMPVLAAPAGEATMYIATDDRAACFAEETAAAEFDAIQYWYEEVAFPYFGMLGTGYVDGEVDVEVVTAASECAEFAAAEECAP